MGIVEDRGKEPRLFFCRDRVGAGIDVLIENNGVLESVEIKRSTNPAAGSVKAFRKIAVPGFPLARGAVVFPTENSLPLADAATFVPAGAI